MKDPICRCEADMPNGVHCPNCMGRTCKNTTYRSGGDTFELVDATLLWSLSYWDGPISGIAVYKGFACYAKSYTMYRHRTFWLYPLKHSEWLKEMEHHCSWHTATPDKRSDMVSFRADYTSRRPLGFFRLNRTHDPLEANRVFTAWQQREHSEFFECSR